MGSSWPTSRLGFGEAAGWFVGVVGQVGDRWERPGLGEGGGRALVGHTSRALLTVGACLKVPPRHAALGSTVDHYLATRATASGADVAQRGRDAGAALGDDPVGAVAEIAARVPPLLDAADGTELVTTIAGGMRLADYL